MLRIQPALWIFLAVLSWLGWSQPQVRQYVVLCAPFVANFAGYFHNPTVSPAWSLCIEEQFYLVWPQAVRRLSTKALAWLSLALAATTLLLRIRGGLLHGGVNEQNTLLHLDGLCLGAFAACCYIAPEKLSPGLLRVRDFMGRWWVGLATAVALIASFALPRWLASIQITAFCVLAYRLISAIANGMENRFLTSRPMRFLGKISYGFYLYHSGINDLVHHFVGKPQRPELVLVRMIVCFAISVAVSSISFYAVEAPIQRLRRFLLRRPAIHSATIAPAG